MSMRPLSLLSVGAAEAGVSSTAIVVEEEEDDDDDDSEEVEEVGDGGDQSICG